MPTDATGDFVLSDDSVAPQVDLSGRVAVVTGASRSIGKGIALELGAAGATVYLTGRTTQPGAIPGTIAETAAQIEALGGVGIPVPVDHHKDDEVAGPCSTEYGRSTASSTSWSTTSTPLPSWRLGWVRSIGSCRSRHGTGSSTSVRARTTSPLSSPPRCCSPPVAG